MKRLFIFILLLILSFSSFDRALAKENKFGIHILEPTDLEKASQLVNSSGGDWGYVTVVIRDDDMNLEKWQNFMNQCRERHLIPLVRIATHLEGPNWVKPKPEDAEKWANFLGSLNWPVKDQYVIIFNEPNQAKEWGGEINPREYSRILSGFNEKLKIKNEKFKILNAGFDLAAGNTKTTMDTYKFWQEMNWEIPGIFEKLDGWSSHSYPNHGFLGKPWDKGRTSIRGYEWEIWILKNHFKVNKDLPILITETGWPAEHFNRVTVASYFKYAFEKVWLNDERIKAVTPFLLNYPESLFSDFSWLDKDGRLHPQYETVKNIPKESWWPEQVVQFRIEKVELPPFLPTNSLFKGSASITNEGQSILGEAEDFLIKSNTDKEFINVSDLKFSKKMILKPFEVGTLEFEIKSGTISGEFKIKWQGLEQKVIKILPSSILTRTRYTLWEKIISKIRFWWH